MKEIEWEVLIYSCHKIKILLQYTRVWEKSKNSNFQGYAFSAVVLKKISFLVSLASFVILWSVIFFFYNSEIHLVYAQSAAPDTQQGFTEYTVRLLKSRHFKPSDSCLSLHNSEHTRSHTRLLYTPEETQKQSSVFSAPAALILSLILWPLVTGTWGAQEQPLHSTSCVKKKYNDVWRSTHYSPLSVSALATWQVIVAYLLKQTQKLILFPQ